MPRFPRVVVPECPHHVTQRGNARRDVFFCDRDRQVYLGLLKQYATLYDVSVLGYCLMTNHVHLVLIPYTELALAKTLREVHMRYAQYRNAIEFNTGHLWQSRYYSCTVDPTHLASVMRYVERNPVRSSMVSDPADFAWSSARAHLCQGSPSDPILDLELWRQWWTPQEWSGILASGCDETAAIRESTYAGRPFGSEEFIDVLEGGLNRRLKRGISGRPRIHTAACVA